MSVKYSYASGREVDEEVIAAYLNANELGIVRSAN